MKSGPLIGVKRGNIFGAPISLLGETGRPRLLQIAPVFHEGYVWYVFVLGKGEDGGRGGAWLKVR